MRKVLLNRRCVFIVAVVVAVVVAVALIFEADPNRFTGITPTWYDVVAILLLALVPGLLVVLMTMDTEKWGPSAIGFLLFFAGVSVLFTRGTAGVYGSPWLSSVEVLWLLRVLLIAGVLLIFVETIHRLVTQRRDWRRGARRLAMLLLVVAIVTGIMWGVHHA